MEQVLSDNPKRVKVENSDILMAVSVIAILLVMVMPLPPFILDILLSFNIACSLVILLTSLYITNPLKRGGMSSLFSTHPPIAERVRRLREIDAAHGVA